MKLVYCILGLFIFTTSCKKEEGPSFVYENDEVVKFKIELQGLHIKSYTKYIDDVLSETTTFYDYDTIIETLTKNALDEVIYKKRYMMSSNNFAKSAIDTNFSSFGSSTAKYEYEYENGFLINTTYDWKYLDNSDSGFVRIFCEIENANIVRSSEFPGDGSIKCLSTFTFNDRHNLIDLRNFSNNITGKVSRNLIDHAQWRFGCPCGPGHIPAYSNFNYEFNTDGSVIKTTEVYTPCYHWSLSEVTRTVITTIFEYNTH